MSFRQLSVFVLAAMFFAVAALRGETVKSLDGLYSLTNWRADDGMPNGDVHSVCRARDGFLWLATNEALVRFDGVQFTPLKLLPGDKKETILSVFEETPGTLLVTGPGNRIFRVRGWTVSVHPMSVAIVSPVGQSVPGMVEMKGFKMYHL